MLLAVVSAPAHEGHAHASERVDVAPFVASLRINFGDRRFRLGPMNGDLLNTLVITAKGRVSIPTRASGMRGLSILHTGLALEEAAKCQVAIKYEGLDEPVIRPWEVHDWQAESVRLPGREVVSGLWWYRRDRGLVVNDTHAKIYVKNIALDPARRLESISLIAPDLAQGEIRVYAISLLPLGTHAWTAIDMSKQFNSDTILSDTNRIPTDKKMYFATELTELLAKKIVDSTGPNSAADSARPALAD